MKSYLESNGGGSADLSSILGEMESFHTQLSAQLQTQYDDHVDQLTSEVDFAETNALNVIAQ